MHTFYDSSTYYLWASAICVPSIILRNKLFQINFDAIPQYAIRVIRHLGTSLHWLVAWIMLT